MNSTHADDLQQRGCTSMQSSLWCSEGHEEACLRRLTADCGAARNAGMRSDTEIDSGGLPFTVPYDLSVSVTRTLP